MTEIHCSTPAKRRGDRWVCFCGAWKWVKPRDEQNRWRASTCLPNADIRADVLRILPDGLELYTKQIAELLNRNEGATLLLLQALESDGVLSRRHLTVEREHTIKRRVCLWKWTGKALPRNPTPVERRVETERLPVFCFDALVMAWKS